MNNFEGTVFSGMNEAEEYLSMKPYEIRLEETIGFIPFPGTLNLRVNEENVKELKKEVDSKAIESFNWQNQSFSGLEIYPVRIDGIDAYYLDIEITDYEEDVMEIIAETKLREKLNLEDGELVTISYGKQ